MPNSESPGNEQSRLLQLPPSRQNAGQQKFVAGAVRTAIDGFAEKFRTFRQPHSIGEQRLRPDRVLRHRYLVVPNWYSPEHRLVYWDKFGQPPRPPRYFQAYDWALSTWCGKDL